MTGTISERILITNDDGYSAPGLMLLAEIARSISDDVWIIAPSEEQSGKGHALSLHEPVRYRQIDEKYFSVKGTPTDCVMMACHMIMPEKPTLLLSGINRGVNLAEDMTYSGTISAAMEGTLCGIPSIGFSQEVARDYAGDLFQVARDHGAQVIKDIISIPWKNGVFINVNFPLYPDRLKGVRTTHQGFRDESELFIEQCQDPRGSDYFWIGFRREYGTPAQGTDLAAVRDGYISVTPLHLDLTHEDSLITISDKMDKDFS
ncbi:5'-nucleotidase SurE [hydrothermal vent metagenome]|uniref:5'-nucleotidase n=1 Tax=hydrothermal vent metagenome TaxID=652676 RepID=A0A3B0RZH6_9ZZZZ